LKEASAKVFIVDDDPLVRSMIAALVAAAGLSAEAFASAQDFLSEFDPSLPGCLICDVSMPGMSGLELQQELNARGAPLAVIFITAKGDVPTAVSAMHHGAFDYLLKPFEEHVLIDCVRTALLRDRETRRSISEITEIRERRARLTEREREVLAHLVEGASNKTMAYELGIAQRTIELHRSNVMNKMGARSIAQLVRMVMNLERAETPAAPTQNR
jgi:two-component system, LuxR family, response regulator FixJ